MQVGVHPSAILIVSIHDDVMRLVPILVRRQPQGPQRRGSACRRRFPLERLPESGRGHGNFRYHHLSGVNDPAALSMIAPSANSVSSANGRPISCSPSGKPWLSRPAGTEMPGKPAIFTVTVNTSLRYISIGSARPLSPMAKAAEGVVGVRIASTTAAKQVSKSRLINVRTFCAQIIRIVITGREHVGADHDAPAHFLAKTGGAGLLVHFDDIAARNAQPVAHTVVAREIGRGLGWRHDVICRQCVFG